MISARADIRARMVSSSARRPPTSVLTTKRFVTVHQIAGTVQMSPDVKRTRTGWTMITMMTN